MKTFKTKQEAKDEVMKMMLSHSHSNRMIEDIERSGICRANGEIIAVDELGLLDDGNAITIRDRNLIAENESSFTFSNRSGVSRIVNIPKKQETKDSEKTELGGYPATTYFVTDWFFRVFKESSSLFMEGDVFYNAED